MFLRNFQNEGLKGLVDSLFYNPQGSETDAMFIIERIMEKYIERIMEKVFNLRRSKGWTGC